MNVGFIVTVVKIITQSRKCENVNGVQIEWGVMIQSVKGCIMIGDQSVTGRPIVFAVLESVTNGTQQMRWYVVEIVMKFTRELLFQCLIANHATMMKILNASPKEQGTELHPLVDLCRV